MRTTVEPLSMGEEQRRGSVNALNVCISNYLQVIWSQPTYPGRGIAPRGVSRETSFLIETPPSLSLHFDPHEAAPPRWTQWCVSKSLRKPTHCTSGEWSQKNMDFSLHVLYHQFFLYFTVNSIPKPNLTWRLSVLLWAEAICLRYGLSRWEMRLVMKY